MILPKNIFVLFLLLMTSCAKIPSVEKFEVHSHLGASGVFPENSMEGMKYAHGVGVDVIDLDVVVTKDNVLAVHHGPFIDPEKCLYLNNKKIKSKLFIRELDSSELNNYRCGHKKDPRYPKRILRKSKILTLKEVFNWYIGIKDPKPLLSLELNSKPAYDHMGPSPFDFAKLIVNLIIKYALEEHVMVRSFDHRILFQVSRLNSRIELIPLLSHSMPYWTAIVSLLSSNIISPHKDWVSDDMVLLTKHAGFKVIPWTANSPNEWQRLIDLRVDGLVTEYPEDLIRFLRERGMRK